MITARLDGARLVTLRLQRLETRLHDRINAAVHEMTRRLLERVVAAEPVRTGRLRGEARATYSDRPTLIAGRVRAAPPRDAARAAALEYGAHGSTPVHAYQRKDGAMVQAYTRRVNIQPHRFLRDSLAAMQGEIDAAFQKAVSEVVDEANA